MKYLLASILLLITAFLFADPMGGTYTVGGTGADFETLNDALDALVPSQMTSDVVFDLNPGTYPGPFEVYDIQNGVYALTITSGSNDASEVIMTNPNANSDNHSIMKVNDSVNLTIDGLTFQPTGTYARSLYISGESDGFSCTNCVFDYEENINASYHEAIYITGMNANSSSDNVSISDNTFYNGNAHIYVNATSSLASFNNLSIINNHHYGPTYWGISLKQCHDVIIRDEIMEDVNQAISISASDYVTVRNNYIYAWGIGVYLSYCEQSAVYNNVIDVNGYNWYYNSYGSEASGLILNNCENSVAYYNSVLNTSTHTGSQAAAISGTNNSVKNNQFVSLGGGYGMYAYHIDPSEDDINIIQNNNIYSASQYVCKVMNTYYYELDDYAAVSGLPNCNVNPFFANDFLVTASPQLDHQGVPVGITVDINGQTRDAIAPDIGAYEYTSSPAMTPLNGTVTVGNGGDFATLADFAYQSAFRGMNGPVTAQLTDAVYEEQFTWHHIPGIGWDHRMTIRPATRDSVTIKFSSQEASNNYVLQMQRCKYITFQNINFETEATSYGNLVDMPGFNGFISFENCSFTAPIQPSSSYYRFSVKAYEYTYVKNINFDNCTFIGNSEAMKLCGDEITITNNSFTQHYNGVELYLTTNSYVYNNDFNGITYWAVMTNGGSDLEVLRNRVFVDGTNGNGFALYNMELGEERNLVANNVIMLTGATSHQGMTFGGNGYNIINNSVWVDGANSTAANFYNSGTMEFDFINNILVSIDGYALDITYYTPSENHIIDYNCYYSESNYLARLGTVYENLTALQNGVPGQNQHSIAINPHLTDDLHTQSPWLRDIGIFSTQITEDMDGDLRFFSFDIGADQHTGAGIVTHMSGNYTIGESGDYETIDDFVADLEFLGIDGDVTATITAGTYQGYHVIRDYPRTGDSHTVTITAESGTNFELDPINPYQNDNFFFLLKAVDNLTLDGLAFSTLSSSPNSQQVAISGRCENINIVDCSFNLPTYCFAISSIQGLGDGLTIDNCFFQGGAYGVYLPGANYDSNHYQNVTINSCQFSGMSGPLYLLEVDNIEIAGSIFNQSFAPIFIAYSTGNIDVHNNRIFASGYSNSSASASFVNLNNIDVAEGNDAKFYNNIINVTDCSCQSLTGLYIGYSDGVSATHNTIVIDNKSYADYGSALSLYNSDNSYIINNILSSPAKGYAATVTSCMEVTWMGNTCYASGKYLGKIDNQYYEPYAFMYTQMGEIEGQYADPIPDENGYAQCSWLRERGISISHPYDIDGNPFGNDPCPGATVIPDGGDVVYSSTIVGTGGSYATLNEAIDDLRIRGIAGNVTLYVASGTYDPVQIRYIPNMINASLSIVRQNQGEVVFQSNPTGNDDNWGINLFNCYNLTLDGFDFESLNSSYANGVVFERYTQDAVINDCSFSTETPNQTSQYCSGVYGYEFPFDGITVQNCDITNMGYGIFIYGTNGSTVINSGVELINNTMNNVYMGIKGYYWLDSAVMNNHLNGCRGYGMHIEDSDQLEIANNVVYSTGSIGILLDDILNTEHEQMIYNNYIEMSGTTSCALRLQDTVNANVVFNTLRMNTTYGNSVGFQQLYGCPGLVWVNNIVKGGMIAPVELNNMSDVAEIHHNLTHSDGAFARIDGTDITTISGYQDATGDVTTLLMDPGLGEGYYTVEGSNAIDSGVTFDGIEYDIDGTLRTDPDRGCWEYTILGLDSPQNVVLSVDDANGMINISWDAVTGAGAYRVYMNTAPTADGWATQTVTGTSVQIPIASGYHYFKITATTSARTRR